MGIFVLPPLNPDPVPPAPTAGLVMVDCETCSGDGYTEDTTTGYRCLTCSGYGQVERCGGCLQAPTVDERGYERCGCNSPEPTLEPIVPCETCNRHVPLPELIEGLCSDCRRTGLEVVIAEDDPYYRAWVAERLELGRVWGWL